MPLSSCVAAWLPQPAARNNARMPNMPLPATFQLRRQLALNSARMPSPTPSPPILVTMAGARPSRAAAVRALPQFPPPCFEWVYRVLVAHAICSRHLNHNTRSLFLQAAPDALFCTLHAQALKPPRRSLACASNCSVRSLSSGLGNAATCGSARWCKADQDWGRAVES